MSKHQFNAQPEHASLRSLWVVLFTALVVSTACSIFAHGLAFILSLHQRTPALIFLLPVILFATRFIEQSYPRWLNLLSNVPLLRIFKRQESISGVLLIPLCWLSHLGGASVGRESVAVHAGRSLATALADLFYPAQETQMKKVLIRVGLASGFAALFGSPWTALVFAFEWPNASEEKNEQQEHLHNGFSLTTLGLTALACACSFLFSSKVWGLEHTHFQIDKAPFDFKWLIFIVSLSVICAILAFGHQRVGQTLSRAFERLDDRPLLRVLLPSLILIAILQIAGADKYKNLGLNFMNDAFSAQTVNRLSHVDPINKSLLTAFSLAAGFRGGEVTPLLAIGAALGALLGVALGISSTVAAAAGFPLVFALVFRVPLTGIFLSAEMFGFHQAALGALPYLLILYLRQRYAAFTVSR